MDVLHDLHHSSLSGAPHRFRHGRQRPPRDDPPDIAPGFRIAARILPFTLAGVRYCRFMASFNELPDAVAERLRKIDYASHLALLAEVFEDRSEIMVAEARYVIDEHD